MIQLKSCRSRTTLSDFAWAGSRDRMLARRKPSGREQSPVIKTQLSPRNLNPSDLRLDQISLRHIEERKHYGRWILIWISAWFVMTSLRNEAAKNKIVNDSNSVKDDVESQKLRECNGESDED